LNLSLSHVCRPGVAELARDDPAVARERDVFFTRLLNYVFFTRLLHSDWFTDGWFTDGWKTDDWKPVFGGASSEAHSSRGLVPDCHWRLAAPPVHRLSLLMGRTR